MQTAKQQVYKQRQTDGANLTDRARVLEYIRDNEGANTREILVALRLSQPTVTGRLSELETDGLIAKTGTQKMQIGNTKTAYSQWSIVREDQRELARQAVEDAAYARWIAGGIARFGHRLPRLVTAVLNAERSVV